MSHAKQSKKSTGRSASTPSSRVERRSASVQREQAPGDAGLMDTAAPPMRLSDASTGDGAPGGDVQAKVKVGAPGDRYEREADTVAQRVTQGQPAPSISSLASGKLRAAQRQEEDEEAVQRQDEAEVQRQTESTEDDVQRREDDGGDEGSGEDDLPVQPQSIGDGSGATGAAPDEDESVQPAGDGSSGGSGGATSSVHARAATAIRQRGAGQPLPRSFRRSVEPLFGRDFSQVRVHTGTDAQEAARSIHAHAFTHLNHIWLGARASTTDASLMTHELTHVVQQGHAPPLRSSGRATPASGVQRVSDDTEDSVQTAAEPVRDDEAVQRFDLWGAVKDVGSSIASGVQAVGQGIANVAGDLMDMGRSALMAVVRRVAPGFARLIERDGLIGLVKDIVKDGFDALFGGVFDDVTSMFDFETLREGFSGAVEAVRETAGQLAEGSASAILDAARNVTTFIGDTLSPVIDTVRSVASTIGDVFDSIVNFVGTPVLDFIERVGGSVWRAFKGIVDDVGAIFSTVQDALGAAWSRVKGWFGITADEGTDEGGGIWEWVKEKASNVWDSVTGAMEPILGPLGEVGRVIVLLSPAGPALALYENWPKLKQAFAWISEQWTDLNIVVRARDYLREKLLPDMKAFLLSVGEGVQEAANWLSENVGGVAEKVDGVIGTLSGGSILAPLRAVFTFVRRQFRRAASFVQTAIRSAGTAVRTLFQRLVAWIDPLLGVLRDLVAAAVNPFGIVGLLLGNFWLALPQALKGVIIDFILDLLRGFIRAIPPLRQLGLLWPFIRSGMLGFLDRMAEFATERKVAVSNKLATIISGGSFSFAMGYLRGLATGIWEAVTAPFYAIAMLFDLPSMIRNFVTMLGELFTGIAEEVREIITLVSERFDETLESVLNAARELLENPGMLIDIISGAIQAALDSVGELGATFAERLMEIFEQPNEKLGEMLGTLTGNILVEVLLAVFTAGAGNAISGVGRVANLLRRIQRNFQRVLRLVADLMRPVLNFIDRIIDLFRGAMSRVGSIFQRIGEGFGRIVDRFRNLFQRLRGRRPRRTPDGPDAPSRPRRADAPPDETPDVPPTPRVRPDTTPDSRPRTDTTPDPDRTPDERPVRPPRDRDGDGRGRRRDDDDDDSNAGWIRFRAAVRRLQSQYASQGAGESELQRDVGRLRSRHRRSVSMRTPLAMMVRQKRGEGVWEVRAAPRDPSVRGIRTVAEVLIERRLRFRLGVRAVRRRLDRLDGNESFSTTYFRRILEPIKDDYRFSRLYAERDQAEDDWNIMGGMSPDEQIDEVADTEGYHFGTHVDPIPLHWYKAPDDYPPFLRIQQFGQERTVPMVTTSPAIIHETTQSRGRERFELGVAPRYAVRLYTRLFKRRQARSRDSDVANRWKWMLFRRGALDPSESAAMHSDHVTDLYFDGPDDHRNLWPLRADVNLRPFHGWLNNRVKYKVSDTELEERRIDDVANKVFRVVGFRYPPPDPGGRDGQ